MELKSIQSKAKTYGVPIIRTKSHEILEEFTKSKNPKHILEIGTAVGFSGITMLSVCDGDLLTIEHNKDFICQAKDNFEKAGFSSRTKIIEGDCHVEIARLLASNKFDGYFDMIFLDGPKAQYNLLLDGLLLLLAEGGTLVADNVLFRGYVEGTTAVPTKRYKTIIKRLNEFIESCKTHESLTNFKLVEIEDGMIFADKV